MNNLVEGKFYHGGIEDTPDFRDYDYSEIGMVSVPFDWNAGFDIEQVIGRKIPVKDQGQTGSCGGQAWSYLGEVLEAIATNSFEGRSAKFIYSQTFVPGGGSAGRDNSNIAVKQGFAREALLPSYENGMPPSEGFMERKQDITDAIRADASTFEAKSYANVHGDIESIVQAIRNCNGVIIGIRGENNGTWTTAFPQIPKNPQWAHWLYAGKAKIINGKKYIGVINSWGTSVGEQGWQWIGEDYLPQIFSIWVLYPRPPEVTPFQYTFLSDMKYGQTSKDVMMLQNALKVDGSLSQAIPSTGFFGENTRKALFQYQINNKVAPFDVLRDNNGTFAGILTRKALNRDFSPNTLSALYDFFVGLFSPKTG